MQSIKKLKQQLQKIEQVDNQMKSIKKIDEIPISQLLKYRKCLQRKKKICEQIKELERSAKGANLLYNYETSCWIENVKINCRKYKRLESKARYKRDLKLYKYGFLEKRPTIPAMQFIRIKFPILNISDNSFFKKIKNLKSKFISKRIDNLIPKEIPQNFSNTYKTEVNKYKESLKVQPQNIKKMHKRKYVRSTVSKCSIPTEIKPAEKVLT